MTIPGNKCILCGEIMQTISSFIRAYDIKQPERHARLTSRAKRRIPGALKYLNENHKYELLLGNKPTGEFKEMLGSEAKKLNEAFVKEFFTECMNDVPGRALKKWKFIQEGQK